MPPLPPTGGAVNTDVVLAVAIFYGGLGAALVYVGRKVDRLRQEVAAQQKGHAESRRAFQEARVRPPRPKTGPLGFGQVYAICPWCDERAVTGWDGPIGSVSHLEALARSNGWLVPHTIARHAEHLQAAERIADANRRRDADRYGSLPAHHAPVPPLGGSPSPRALPPMH